MAGNTETRGLLDLRKQFIFYASYHNNTVNVAIHLFCIWNLVWSGLVLFHHTPVILDPPAPLSNFPLIGDIPVNIPLFITLTYVITYVLMDPVAGGIGALLMLFLNKWTWTLVSAGNPINGFPLWQPVLGFHLVMWIAQFIGHGVFEGRAPALLDSLDQAFITAPLFVILEILCFLGYKKEFYDECMVEVEKQIEAFRNSKTK